MDRLTLTYGDVERVLATLHFQSDERIPAFRARLKYLKRLGVPIGESPGRGKRIEYSREHLYQMALALEFIQFGIDPDSSAAMTKHHWPKLYKDIFRRAEVQNGIESLFLVLTPEFIARHSSSEVLATYSIRGCLRGELMAELDRTTDKAGRDTRRKCFLNVSNLLKRLNELADGVQQ